MRELLDLLKSVSLGCDFLIKLELVCLGLGVVPFLSFALICIPDAIISKKSKHPDYINELITNEIIMAFVSFLLIIVNIPALLYVETIYDRLWVCGGVLGGIVISFIFIGYNTLDKLRERHRELTVK